MKTTSQGNHGYNILWFFFLAFGFTWAYWIPQALATKEGLKIESPNILAILAGYGPALAAIITIGIASGWVGIKRLLSRLLLWRVGIIWYLVALFLPLLTVLLAMGIQLMFDSDAHATVTLLSLQTNLSEGSFWKDFLMFGILFIVGFDGFGEELGWRGFALPGLLLNYNALVSSLFLGVLWAVWHLPFQFAVEGTMSVQSFASFLLGILSTSILFTWLYKNTNGSILLCILFHAAFNLTNMMLPRLLPEADSMGYWNTFSLLSIALIVIIRFGPSQLSKKIAPRSN
ncbi:MAG TPA: CPBP family intramembrane glutamic endopeptidase [Eudoraea sp.]|nr:CPBP family intramembrane glutamic endopeptidase [Eudoraea sp.]